MAQADYIISNQTFPNTRADINNHLSAIATNNSGTSAPTTQYAGQFWIDTTTTTWTLYIHDGTDDIQFATIDTSANTVNFTDSALDVVTDTTPQLGGDLDLNSNDITGTGNINITGTATVSGDLTVDTNTLYVDSTNNRVGVATASPQTPLHVYRDSAGTANIRLENTESYMQIRADGDAGFIDANTHIFKNKDGSTERMRIDSSGNLALGATSAGTRLHVVSGATLVANLINSGGNGSHTRFIKGVSDILQVRAVGTADCELDASGGYLAIKTSGTEAMRIDTSGVSYFGTTNGNPGDANVVGTVIRYDSGQKALSVTGDGNTPCVFNLKGTDGNVVNINQDGTTEGAISVSGTTVTFVGGHLGRWSQLTTNTRDESIVKGTVMSNLDEMCVWGDEDNEQLNKMKVSDTEGDDNVAGVFVSWDDFDEVYTNDMNIAMTGDMVIRIAQGVTVTKGQLLMSAGDGTAKPQGDDIVRSKTIAKVTSNNVTKTYDDGSYLVPCVLMAC